MFRSLCLAVCATGCAELPCRRAGSARRAALRGQRATGCAARAGCSMTLCRTVVRRLLAWLRGALGLPVHAWGSSPPKDYPARVVWWTAVVDVCSVPDGVSVPVLGAACAARADRPRAPIKTHRLGHIFGAARGPHTDRRAHNRVHGPALGPERGTRFDREGVSTDSRWTPPPGQNASHKLAPKRGPRPQGKEEPEQISNTETGFPLPTHELVQELLREPTTRCPQILARQYWLAYTKA